MRLFGNSDRTLCYSSPIVIFAYVLSNLGLLLLGNHPFWDDWILVDRPSWLLLDTFKQAGSFFNIWGYIHVGMLSIGPWFYRFVTLILFYGVGYHFFRILRRSNILNEEQSNAAAILFLFFPLNLGRNALILFPYSLCLYLFMLAWALLPTKRSIALSLFFVSFNINSLLVFYLLPLLEDFFNFRFDSSSDLPSRPGGTARIIVRYLSRRKITLLLPVLYLSLKIIFFRPYGYYVGYNENYSVLNLIKSPVLQLAELGYSVYKLDLSASLFLALLIFVCFALKRIVSHQTVSLSVLSVSFLATYIGILPYHIIGLVPTFTGWSSRHQLLMPFGLSVLLSYCIFNLSGNFSPRRIFIFILVAFLVATSANSISFFSDSRKQRSIQELFQSSLDDNSPRLIVLVDRSQNALRRKYRFYEINGMLAKSTGNENSFGILASDVPAYSRGEFDKYFTNYYLASGHRREPKPQAAFIIINPSTPFNPLSPSSSSLCIIRSDISNVNSIVEQRHC
jgi:hypothetical protein